MAKKLLKILAIFTFSIIGFNFKNISAQTSVDVQKPSDSNEQSFDDINIDFDLDEIEMERIEIKSPGIKEKLYLLKEILKGMTLKEKAYFIYEIAKDQLKDNKKYVIGGSIIVISGATGMIIYKKCKKKEQ